MNIEQEKELFSKEKENLEAEKRVLKKKSLNESLKAVIIIFIIVIELIIGWFFLVKYGVIEDETLSKNKIAIAYFDKTITYKTILETIDKIDRVVEDKEYKEILFIMNSPGGSPSASEELSEYLKGVTKKKKVTMYVGGYALSGGYYIASSIKPLLANKNALVGSIGVIMQYMNIKDLAKKVGVKEVAITKGKYKQPFSIFKDLDENMSGYLDNNMLEPMYQNFIEAVAINRGVDKKRLLEFTEGKIFLANSKKVNKVLVDKITSFYKLREEYKKRYGKDVKFVNILEEHKGFNLLKGQVDLNFNSINKEKIEF